MPERETLTVDEAAARLGIGRNAAYAAVKRGDIPHIRLGNRIVIPPAAFERMMQYGTTAGSDDATA